MEKVRLIRERLKIARVTKSHISILERGFLEFYIGDWVYLKFHHEGSVSFCKKAELSPRYIVLNKVMIRVGKVTYELDLPLEIAMVGAPCVHVEKIYRRPKFHCAIGISRDGRKLDL